MKVVNIVFEEGYLIVHRDSGAPIKYPIADMLRAADIPVLTYAGLSSIKALANLVVVLIRTLIDREILDESFLENDDLDLDAIIYAIEQLGGSYHDPDIMGN